MFETLKLRYEKNWCRKDQLAMYVKLNVITAEEYESICGEPMSSNELLEVHDLIQQQAAVIEKQNAVIKKLLLVIGQHAVINELSN